MAFKFCTSLAATWKAGANVSTDVLTNKAMMDAFSTDAERSIEQETNTDYTTNYSGLSASMSGALSDVTSSKIAKRMIQFDMGNYNSQREAETLLDVNDDIISSGIKVLKGKADKLKAP